MAKRTYSATVSNTFKKQRWGYVGEGLRSNNPYFSETASSTGVLYVSEGNLEYQPPDGKTINRLYDKLKSEINGQHSELLTASAEWSKSLSMVNERTLWILRSLKSYKAHGLVEFVRTLAEPVAHPWKSGEKELVRSRNKRARPRSRWKYRRKPQRKFQRPSDAWLEYWLGWAPAMGDIYNALDVLQREFPTNHVSVGVGYRRDWQTSSGTSPSSSFYTKRLGVGLGRAGCYTDVKVYNYNLHLLDQMGLVNPLLTGFQIIPLSFVLNWFINVEQVLGALTDFAGLSFTKTGLGVREERQVHQVGFQRITRPEGGYTYISRSGGYNGHSLRREPGTIPRPTLGVKFDRLKLTQAMTSVSLLVNALSKKM